MRATLLLFVALLASLAMAPAANAADEVPSPRVYECTDGYFVIWEPYFITGCIPVRKVVGDGPQVNRCTNGGIAVTWHPYFMTACFP